MKIKKSNTRAYGHFFFLLSFSFLLFSCSSKKSELKAEGKVKLLHVDHASHALKTENFVIASQGKATSQAAIEMIKSGGNIIDAAIAASFTISVERPHSTGLGGGGFLIYYRAKDKKTFVYDFREMAPISSYQDIFLKKNGEQVKEKSITGPFAVGVPGLVKGLVQIHKDFGKARFNKTTEFATKLAENGLVVYPELHDAIKGQKKRLLKFSESKKIFLRNDGSIPPVGAVLTQKDLAKTLRVIAKSYGDDFYNGGLSKKIISSVKEYGGILSERDFKEYTVKMRTPVKGTYKGYEIISMPPPSSGGTHIIQILNMLENDELHSYGPMSSHAIHLTSSAMQLAFRDRQLYMGDTDFVKVPLKKILSKDYAKELRKKIDLTRAKSFNELKLKESKPKSEPTHTTHFSIMDKAGNTVVTTQTINGHFGSAMVAKGTGVVLNNEMDDFSASKKSVNLFGAIGGENNLVAPRKRPLSSMSPTIVLKNGSPVLALGSPSGTRILTCVALTVLNFIEYKLNLWDSIATTRYHHQWYPDEIRVDTPFLPKKVKKELKELGYKINESPYGCSVQAVSMQENGKLYGVSDMRREGMVLGL